MRRHGFTFLLGARASCPCRRDEGGTPSLRMRIPQRAGAAAPAVRPARRFSIGRGGEAGSAACARIRARDAPADVMEIENLIRYTALAVGLKPSASQGEARLRGLYRIIYSKTIISVAAWRVRFRECSASFTRFNLV